MALVAALGGYSQPPPPAARHYIPRYLPPPPSCTEGSVPTLYRVELRVQYGGTWHRLMTGARYGEDARLLFDSLDHDLDGTPHELTLIRVQAVEQRRTGIDPGDDTAACDSLRGVLQ